MEGIVEHQRIDVRRQAGIEGDVEPSIGRKGKRGNAACVVGQLPFNTEPAARGQPTVGIGGCGKPDCPGANACGGGAEIAHGGGNGCAGGNFGAGC